MALTETVTGTSIFKERTIREELANQITAAQDNLVRLTKLEHTIPARYLEMTRDQVWEKFGFHIHF